jgi:hypothetical protein
MATVALRTWPEQVGPPAVTRQRFVHSSLIPPICVHSSESHAVENAAAVVQLYRIGAVAFSLCVPHSFKKRTNHSRIGQRFIRALLSEVIDIRIQAYN